MLGVIADVADGRRRQTPALEVLPPSNDVRPGDEMEFLGAVDTDKGAEVGNVELVGASGFRIGDVRNPFAFGGGPRRGLGTGWR